MVYCFSLAVTLSLYVLPFEKVVLDFVNQPLFFPTFASTFPCLMALQEVCV